MAECHEERHDVKLSKNQRQKLTQHSNSALEMETKGECGNAKKKCESVWVLGHRVASSSQ